MTRRASSSFQDLQRRFAAHIRDPVANPPPPDVSARRMAVYTELFFRSLERHLADGFPVIRRITPDDRWEAMVRGFMRDHRARTPLFPALGREFVEFLERHSGQAGWPEFLPELAAYEHLEVVVALSDADVPDAGAVDSGGDLLDGVPVVAPGVQAVRYRFPVHRIGPDFQPASRPDQPTYLLVYRGRDERASFMELNALSHGLIRLLTEGPRQSGRATLCSLADTIGHASHAEVIAAGHALLQRLRDRGVILGAALPASPTTAGSSPA